MTSTVIDIGLTEAQIKFLQSKERGTVFLGGIGSGKSLVLCLWAITRAIAGRRVALVSYSYPALRDVVLDTCKKILIRLGLVADIDYEIKLTDMTIKLWKGEVLLRSGDRPDSLRGLNLDDFGIDEAREFMDDELFKILLGRIRESEDGEWRISSTSRGRNWVWQLAQEVPCITQSTFDNPFLPEAYKNELRARFTKAYARQELYAEIVELGAGVINEKWFKVIESTATESQKVRFWDLAVTTETSSDNSSGALCSMEDDKFVIRDIRCVKLSYPDLRKLIIETAIQDGTSVTIGVEEAGQQRALIDDLRTLPELRNFIIKGEKPIGEKYNRAMVWCSRAEAGFVQVIRAPWNRNFFDECSNFTADNSHKHDDQLDSVSGAYALLNLRDQVTFRRF